MDTNRIFGGNPLGVIIRLAIISVIVGIVLQALDISPPDLLRRLQLTALRIYDMGFDVFRGLGSYLLVGAVVVVPIWLIARLFGAVRTPPK